MCLCLLLEKQYECHLLFVCEILFPNPSHETFSKLEIQTDFIRLSLSFGHRSCYMRLGDNMCILRRS